MHSIPDILQTRADYELAHELALSPDHPQCRPAKMSRHWQGLLNTRQHYVFDRNLADQETTDGPGPEYLVLAATDDTPRQQFRLADNPTSRLTALDYTEAEVADKITELEVPY